MVSPNRAVNILHLIEDYGEEFVQKTLEEFFCPKNPEIENFLHQKAITFAKRRISITYLVFDEKMQLIGYFTLTHKAISVPVNSVSKTLAKKIKNYSRYEESTNSFEVSAFLIAQFGKNYATNSSISGNELMSSVLMILQQIRTMIGGSVVFLECEHEPKLVSFYQNEHNHFHLYGERISADNIEYYQLLRLL
ncbi:MAG: GNAT family acetyltransferase [Lachnospiraceae bacterium]|nr:GNAT family acetyltransferase [Lachnospiraceae bacterium]